jgi:hypothetical protein
MATIEAFNNLVKLVGGNVDEILDMIKNFENDKKKGDEKPTLKGDDKEPKKKGGRKPKAVETEPEKKDADKVSEKKPEEKPAPKKRGPKPKTDKKEEGDKPEPEKKVEEKEEKGDVKETEKRIKRMSPIMSDQLKKSLADADVPCDEKMFTKLKKKFTDYVDSLTEDDFKNSSLTDHMRDFAKLEKGDDKKPEEDTEMKVDETEKEPEPSEASKGGGAADVPSHISLEDFQKRFANGKLTKNTSGTAVFWDAENGDLITGPEEDPDEDLEEEKFHGKTFAVGVKTGRVYETVDDKDVFVGFKGVGQFKDM